jgi:hypothetical protein
MKVVLMIYIICIIREISLNSHRKITNGIPQKSFAYTKAPQAVNLLDGRRNGKGGEAEENGEWMNGDKLGQEKVVAPRKNCCEDTGDFIANNWKDFLICWFICKHLN